MTPYLLYIVDCGDPPNAMSPLMMTSNSTVAVYSCQSGHQLVGEETISICQNDGTWSEINAGCIGILNII